MINKKNFNSSSINKRMSANANGSSGNGGNFSVMDWSKTGKDKEELKFFKPSEGKNVIDIIPYEIKSKNHPLVKKGELEIGDSDYMIEAWQHNNIGPSQKTVLCLNRMYGKACPICEAASALKKSGDEDAAKKLYAKQRAFYNVIDSKEPDVVKVFDVSYKLFEKELIDEAKDDEEGFTDFVDPSKKGKSVKFKASKESGGDFTFLEFKSFAFLDRDEDIPDDLLEQAISFDELLKIPTYDEVLAIYQGEDDDKPSKNNRDDDDEDEDERPRKRNRDNDDDEDERPARRNRDDEDDEDERPRKSRRNDDEDDEDERPSKKSKSFDDMDEVDSKKPKCPCGHTFGKDNNCCEDCDTCKLWEACADEQDRR